METAQVGACVVAADAQVGRQVARAGAEWAAVHERHRVDAAVSQMLGVPTLGHRRSCIHKVHPVERPAAVAGGERVFVLGDVAAGDGQHGVIAVAFTREDEHKVGRPGDSLCAGHGIDEIGGFGFAAVMYQQQATACHVVDAAFQRAADAVVGLVGLFVGCLGGLHLSEGVDDDERGVVFVAA